MIARRSAGLVRRWVGLYTRGLSVDVRDGRRAEIEADLWDQLEEAKLSGRPERSTGADILMRLARGLPADLSWRMALWADREVRPATKMTATTGTRAVGLLAIVGGLGVAIGAVTFAGTTLVESRIRPWEQGIDPLHESIMAVAGTVGMIAIAAATVGLVARFRHRTGNVAVMAASIGAAGGVLGALGVWPLLSLAPAGMAYFIWHLGRAGVLSRRLASVHAVSTMLLLVPIAAIFTGAWVGVGIALAIPNPLMWLAVGRSLVRGTPAAGGA
jgi:hypothetical protein